jgi:hypothetical protein
VGDGLTVRWVCVYELGLEMWRVPDSPSLCIVETSEEDEMPIRTARFRLNRLGPKSRLKGQNNRDCRRLKGRERQYLMSPLRR